MKSKIIILLNVIFFFALRTNAQTTEPAKPEMGVRSFGVSGGVNFQNINGKDMNGNKLTNTLITRFHLGVNEQIPVAPEFYLQVGLQYAGKGCKGTVMYKNFQEVRWLEFNYIEVPINFLYKPLVGSGHFLLGFGPYVAYSFLGKAKFTGEVYNLSQNINYAHTINLENPNDLAYFRHLDVGANAFFGYEFKNKLSVTFDAQLGLVNVNSKNDFYPSSKLSEMNTGFGLSLGYRF